MAPCCPIYYVSDVVKAIKRLSKWDSIDMCFRGSFLDSVLFVYPSGTLGIRPHFNAMFGIINPLRHSSIIDDFDLEDIENLVSKYLPHEVSDDDDLTSQDFSCILWIMGECRVSYNTACIAYSGYPYEIDRAIHSIKLSKPSHIFNLGGKATTMEEVD